FYVFCNQVRRRTKPTSSYLRERMFLHGHPLSVITNFGAIRKILNTLYEDDVKVIRAFPFEKLVEIVEISLGDLG
ncbi:hypothetical protein HID58_070727, partial [Brassica napus]